MPIDHVLNSPWTRKHDDPRFNLIPRAPKTVYPRTLAELISLCKNRPPGERYKAAGSHWALSQAAISDHTFIETHDPRNVHQAMGRTLDKVIPGCMHSDVLNTMGTDLSPESRGSLIHVEAGKRIYQLYSELDTPDNLESEETLAGYFKKKFSNPSYARSWALETLGNAGGQTVAGAFSTGTHGGDFTLPPISDSVLAIHLVADGGKHYWIEAIDERYFPQLTDDDKLYALYGTDELGGQDNFKIIRDNVLFDAVLVSAGRFGVIYSVVLRAVPQYSMYERRRLHVWQDIKHQIKELDGPLYTDTAPNPAFIPSTAVVGEQRGLQIAVSLTPHANFQRNLVGVTKRWQLALPTPPDAPAGRAERVGTILNEFDERIQAPLFALAGANHPFSPDPANPQRGADPSVIERACADASFLKGVINVAIEEIEDFVNSNGAVAGAGIAAVAVIGGIGLAALIPALFAVLLILRELLDLFDDDTRFGETMEGIKNELLDPDEPDPVARAAGLFAWQLIFLLAFREQQSERDYEAVSYAVMDQKDYLNISCEVNVDSVEIFFDAEDDRLIAFVDELIAFETTQELAGRAFVGYAALRFMGRSRALLGMQKHFITCSVEVACLRDVSGSQELIDFAVELALNPNFGGVLHWGQRNDSTATDIERLFGDSNSPTNGDLGAWRDGLSLLTDGGTRDGFSSEFTRRTGLEVN